MKELFVYRLGINCFIYLKLDQIKAKIPEVFMNGFFLIKQ